MAFQNSYYSPRPFYSFPEVEENDFQDLLPTDTVGDMITQMMEIEGLSPTTWTSFQGILTPTSSSDQQYEQRDLTDELQTQAQQIASQNEVLGHLTAISPTLSMATTFDISEEEVAQDISQDGLFQAMRATQLQQTHQNSWERPADGLFHGSGPNVGTAHRSFPNAMVNNMDMQLVWRTDPSSSADSSNVPPYQASGNAGSSTQAQAPRSSAQYCSTAAGPSTFNRSSNSADNIVPPTQGRIDRGDSPWSPLGVPSTAGSGRSYPTDASWLGNNMQQMARSRGNLLAPKARTNNSSFIGPSPPKRAGGRNGGLKLDVRKGAAMMRVFKGCWVCGIRRENCDPGSPCNRCALISQRGQAHHLGCDRRHLKDMLLSFLPEKMSPLKQYSQLQSFEKLNMKAMLGNWIPVDLTVGCGPCLSLVLYEFEPTHNHFLFTSAYVAEQNGTWRRQAKRSPPLAIQQITKSVKDDLERFVNDMVSTYLRDFQDMSCDGEDAFLPDLLKLLCDLYINLGTDAQNKTLQEDVHLVLTMLVLTHIIGHAITIDQDAQASVVSGLSHNNDPGLYQEWTSPRMANVQLKQIFGEIRDKIMTKTLNRLHQILRSAKDKNRTWLSSFVIMLGIAMVSEDYQHLLHIQADHYMSRGEKDPAAAQCDAREGCKQIDDGFEFLQQLFHYKYRPKHHTKARFTEWNSKTFHQAEATFIHSLEDSANYRTDYLLFRKDLQLNSMAEGNHSARLVARFLADFMDLEPASP